jgi:hypothetical protein
LSAQLDIVLAIAGMLAVRDATRANCKAFLILIFRVPLWNKRWFAGMSLVFRQRDKGTSSV